MVVAAGLLAAVVGLWLGWSRLRPPVVQTTVARAAAPGTGGLGARRERLRHRAAAGHRVGQDHRQGHRGADRGGHAGARGGGAGAGSTTPRRAPRSCLAQAQLAAARSQLAEIAGPARAGRARLRPPAGRSRPPAGEPAEPGRGPRPAATCCARGSPRPRSRSRWRRSRSQVAQVQLDNTVIRAPFSGVVIAKSAQPGEMISPISAGGGFTRTGIGTIVDMDSLEIQVDVNESYINRVTAGPAGRGDARTPIRTGRSPAQVIAIIPTADRSKATVKVRIALEQKDSRIVPDMGVRVASSSRRDRRPPRRGQPGVLVPADGGAARGQRAARRVRGRRRRQGASADASRSAARRGGADRQRAARRCAAGERVVLAPPADARRTAQRRHGSTDELRARRRPTVAGRDPRRHQDLPARQREGRGAARHRPRHPARATSWRSWARPGSGKTTLLNLIGGLDTPSGGQHRGRRPAHRSALERRARALARAPTSASCSSSTT